MVLWVILDTPLVTCGSPNHSYDIDRGRNRFRNQLSSLYAQAEIDHIFKCCIAHYFNWEGIKIGLTPELILHAEEETILLEVLNSLADATPLQYILGETLRQS